MPDRIRAYLIQDRRDSGKWTRAILDRMVNQAALSELDHRYWDFVETLPPRLARLATDRRTIAGEGPSTQIQSVAGVGFPVGMPWMFRDAFPGLDEEQLIDVSEAWLFLLVPFLLRDHIADSQVSASPDADELRQRLMARARSAFRSLVGNQPAFWQRFEGYERQVVSALQLEAHHRASPGEYYDLARAWQIGCGKSALGKTVPCVLAVLSETLAPLPHLEQSMDALVAGRQLLDDVSDWQEDLARGHCTFPLAQAASRLKEAAVPVTPETIEAELNNSTIREEALSQSRAWHQQALIEVDAISCHGWIDLVRHSLADCISYHAWLILYRIAQAAKEKGPITQS